MKRISLNIPRPGQRIKTYLGRLLHFLRQRRVMNRLSIAVAIGAVLSGLASYSLLTARPIADNTNLAFWLLIINVILVLVLSGLVAYRIISLWVGRRRNRAGSKLHIKLVTVFGALAIIPAAVMAIFAGLFITVGVQSFFDDRIATAIEESQAVARAYLEEHKQVMRADIQAMAADIDRQSAQLVANPGDFEEFLQTQSFLRNFTGTAIIDSEGRVMERSGPSILMDANPVTDVMIQQANRGSVVLTTNDTQDRMRGLVQLNNLSGAYLFVTRPVDGRVLNHISMTSDIANQYLNIKGRRVDLQLSMMILFGLFSLLLLMAAVWFGLHFSEQLIRPVRKLVAGAERVRAGELDINIPDQGGEDELSDLTQAFNRMTDRLNEQRDALIAANRQIDERRQFIETVLSGVSAGVIGVSGDGKIQLANQSAARILGMDPVGRHLTDIFVSADDIIAPLGPDKPQEQQSIDYDHPDGGTRNLRLHIGVELDVDNRVIGYVITLDDMTELIAAQRKAAWGDVAQRIAHEIKNPLTPIQLAAERLRHRYSDQIDDDVFKSCTDTIVRHVGNIGRMVREFSNFARLPEPVRRPVNLNTVVKNMLDFQRQANPAITFTFTPAGGMAKTMADQDQVEQAISNVIINAAQAMEEQDNQQITLTIQNTGGYIDLRIADNGPGFPADLIGKITDPYVTTREGGTGLGLAIVRKIMDDHEGKLMVENRSYNKQSEESGAVLTLRFPVINDHNETYSS